MFDAQAWYARDVILGRIALPTTAAMRADSEAWLAREEATTSAEQDIDFQTEYVRDLLDATDYPDFNVEAVATLFKQWKHDKKEDILGYRNYSYRSVLTGTLAPLHHTPWMQAMDDSLEAFLADSVIEEQPRRIA